jgi:probable HAF family extracellular repeat protein
MQKLWSSDSLNRDYGPRAIGASEKIVGVTSFMSPGRLMVWDSADAAPRFLGDGFVGGVVGINAQGDFLVNYEIHGFRAVLWRNNVRVDLGALGDTVEAGSGSLAAAWNDAGQIVGGSTVAGLFHPFIWENGVMRDLGVLGSECLLPPGKNCSSGHATAINAHGVVVGKSTTDSMSRAFIWKDGVMRDLGVFPGHSTRALAINDHGQVLGAVGDAGWRRTQRDDFSARDTIFLWDNDRLDVVTTATIVQLWLTPDGTVVGTTLVEHEAHAFVWEAGVLTDLGPRSWVNDVNSHGEMVGWRGDMPTLWRRKGS